MKNLSQVHLNGLRAVEAVARLGSLQAAAEELGVSIGAVSQQVIKTEQQLGRPLFERTSRGMVPVESAIDVLARLSDGFRHLSGAVALARRSDESVLTISVAPSLPLAGSSIAFPPFRNASRKSDCVSTRTTA